MPQHPYAALHAETQRKVLSCAEEYGIEEIEARIWHKMEMILRAPNPEEAERLAQRAWNAAQVHFLLTWGKRRKKRDDGSEASGGDGAVLNA